MINLNINEGLIKEDINLEEFIDFDPTFISRYLIIAVILKNYQS